MLLRVYLESEEVVLAWVQPAFDKEPGRRYFENKDFEWKPGLSVGYAIDNRRPGIGQYLSSNVDLTKANSIWTYEIEGPFNVPQIVGPVYEVKADFFLRQTSSSPKFLHLNLAGEFHSDCDYNAPGEAPGSLAYFLLRQVRKFRLEMRGDHEAFGRFVRVQEELWGTEEICKNYRQADDRTVGMYFQGHLLHAAQMFDDIEMSMMRAWVSFDDTVMIIQTAMTRSAIGRYFEAWSRHTLGPSANHGHPIRPFMP